ncbi:MAG: hypothetical protein GY865_17085 [candidate division Zixibacteria bacterium]|nr:hypothetical protein [candidate division Zixibacteria bacterium]
MYSKKVLLIISLLGLAILLFACSKKSTNSTTSAGVYKIAFSLDVADNEQNNIYTINPDGTEMTQLTFASSTSSNDNPIWSPDGNYIYYKDFMDESNEIIRMNADGTNKVNLTQYAGLDRLCDISSDGTKMAFVSNREQSTFNLFVMDLDSLTLVNITGGQVFEGRQAKFTPDGLRLLYSTYTVGYYDLRLEDIDGIGKNTLSNHTYDDTHGVVSPNGLKIAYISILEGSEQKDIWVCDIDGTNRIMISTSSNDDLEPYWSPNSQKVAYTELLNSDTTNIIVVDIDGSNAVCLTDSSAIDHRPTWSPDGTKIAYISYTGSTSELFIMNSDGTEKAQLTNTYGTGRVYYLSWSPAL